MIQKNILKNRYEIILLEYILIHYDGGSEFINSKWHRTHLNTQQIKFKSSMPHCRDYHQVENYCN